MTIFLLFFGGYLLGMGIGGFIARKWNIEIIETQKEYICDLVSEILRWEIYYETAKKTKKSK